MRRCKNFIVKHVICENLLFSSDHRWSDWQYEEPAKCAQLRTCQRCGQLSRAMRHRSSIWRYEAEATCTGRDVCTRCGQEFAPASMRHCWSDWSYTKPDSCEQERVCTRCGEHEERENHPWTSWQPDENEHWRSCQRCIRRAGGAHQFETIIEGGSGGGPVMYSWEKTACVHCGYVRQEPFSWSES
jgi:hypothetical protein